MLELGLQLLDLELKRILVCKGRLGVVEHLDRGA